MNRLVEIAPAVINALEQVVSRSKIFAGATAVLSTEDTETLESVTAGA